MPATLRELVLGKPLATHRLEDETLPKAVALPVFSSDALSSVAYATQEMMIALAVAGAVWFQVSIWLALAIFTLLIIVTASYNQTIAAYPKGGGAYNVASDNIGVIAAQVAAVSLMTDYIMTVAVSVAAGIDAILSAMMTVEPAFNTLAVRLGLCIVALWFIVLMNLRGVRESGRFFALPVYIFIFSILSLIGAGLWELYFGGGFAHLSLAPTSHLKQSTETLAFIGVVSLILHSFANGCTALTGLEAISNSTAAFKAPKSHNAQVTMWWLAAFLGSMLIGVTWLAQRLAAKGHIVPSATGETVISQIAHATVGHSWFYWCIQISTFAVLVLAANTSFTGFPRLGAMVAADRYLPRQFMTLGDKLVFSNGIIILGVITSVILLAFKGNTDHLIPLYAIGVYTAFTLSQYGMVNRWKTLKTKGWRVRAAMNGIGAAITGFVAINFAVVKFREGAWVVLILIPSFTYLLHRIGKHYAFVASRLSLEKYAAPEDTRTHIALVPAHELNNSVMGAIEYARTITAQRGGTVEALQWTDRGDETAPLTVEGAATFIDRTSPNWRSAIVNRIRTLRDEQNVLVSLVLPEELPLGGLAWPLRRKTELLVKLALLNERGVVVCDTRRYRIAPGLDPAVTRTRGPIPHTAVVLIPSVHRGTMEGLNYARRISREVQALHIELVAEDTEPLRQKWEKVAPDVPLLIMESPYRQLQGPLIRYIRALRVHKPGCIITVVVPEFVAPKWWDKLLHNHAGLLVKLALRSESGIVVSNPRYFLDTPAARQPTTSPPGGSTGAATAPS
ncbi:MAG TPA: APC family permease [Armatimonadota bacterium]|nr:APC family permease [Armatimonadota bacterium]